MKVIKMTNSPIWRIARAFGQTLARASGAARCLQWQFTARIPQWKFRAGLLVLGFTVCGGLVFGAEGAVLAADAGAGAAKPAALIAGRAGVAVAAADSAVLTVTVTSPGGLAAGEFLARTSAPSPLLMSLRAAVRAGDAADTRTALEALGGDYANATAEDGVTPLLMTAALLGHAEVVKILITAGADPDSRHPIFSGSAVPHMMARADAVLSRTERYDVLESFGDATEARSTVYDWNRADGEGFRPLERMRGALDNAGKQKEETDIMRMVDYLLKKGAVCQRIRPNAWRFHRGCIGDIKPSLVHTITRPGNLSESALLAHIAATRRAGVSPGILGDPAIGHILPLAALEGRAVAVSILLTAGAAPDETANGRTVPHHAARRVERDEEEALDILRHFIGGMHAAGLASSYAGWNNSSDIGRPLDALATYAPLAPTAETLEMAGLMYERGARCVTPTASIYCGIPVDLHYARIDWGETGWGLTLTARGFGGAVFTLPPPDAGKRGELASIGLTLRADTAADPDELIASWARQGPEGGDAVFTVTMTGANNQPARAFRVRVKIAPAPALASLRAAVRAGDAAQVESLLTLSDFAHADAVDDAGVPLLIVAATLGHAAVVSVLAAAGADPDAREPSLDRGVPHLTAADDSSLLWAQKSEVLRHFIGGMRARAAVLNWNQADGRGRWPLDLLWDGYSRASQDDRAVIMGMADRMLPNGASCETREWPYSPVCLGSHGLSLVALLDRPEGADDAEIIAATRAVTAAGISLSRLGSAWAPVLLGAAEQGHAAAVSIFIVAGANPASGAARNFNILHAIALNEEEIASATMLETTRYFLGGLHVAGLADSFDGWNAGLTPPLNFIPRGYGAGGAAVLEIAALLYERGARCRVGEGGSGSHCDVPVERREERFLGSDVGAALTLAARDFGGATFALLPPDAGKLAALASIGLTMRTNTAADPDEIILSLWRTIPAGGAAVFTVTMVDGSNRAMREFRVSVDIDTSALASLRAAARSGDAELTRFILAALGPAHADATDHDGITPLLIAAATLGHAEVVSVLVVGGANPDSVLGGGAANGVLHLMASDNSPPQWADKLNVLRSFSGALEARATVADWNRVNILDKRPLDLLSDSSVGADANDGAVILQISDLMLKNGASCATGAWPYSTACAGSLGGALTDILDREAPDGAAAGAAWRAIEDAGLDPNLVGGGESPILTDAGLAGRAAAVSILITLGADLDGPFEQGLWRAIADEANPGNAPEFLEVARHFLGGLHAAGLADSYDGWNRGAPPLLARFNDSAGPAALEIAALLYERGARCEPGARAKACGVPFENRLARIGVGETDWLMTLAARDFAGAVFSMPQPDAGKLAVLASIGMTLRANAAANPEELILSLSDSGVVGGSAVFTVTMTDTDNQAAREFRVRAETVEPLLASLWNAAREGDAARTKRVLDALGPEHADAADRDGVTPLLIVAATLGHAEVVSALVAAGADPDARHPSLFNRGVPHLMAAAGLPPSSALSVLRSFSGALSARATVLDWNQGDSRNERPLETLNETYEDADEDRRAVLLQISDEMLKNRAMCLYDEWPYSDVCVGSLGRVLVDHLDREAPDIAAVSVAWRAATDAGIEPNLLGSEDWPLFIGMGVAGRAAAVSIAIVVGANPNAMSVYGNLLYEIGYWAYDGRESAMLNVARHFLGGLYVAGLNDSFDGWNASIRHPLEDVDGLTPESLEIAALLYERGSRCQYVHSEAVCGVPVEERLLKVGGAEAGWSATLSARDFAGAVFSMPLPDAGKLAALASLGLTLRANAAADPDELIVSLWRENPAGGAAAFTVTMTDASNRAAREFRVSVDIDSSTLALLRVAARGGDAARTKLALDALGPGHADATDRDGLTPLLIVAATLGHAEVVSVLVAAGADPDARAPLLFNRGVPHLMAAEGAPRARALAVLRSFSGALAARATVLNWNQADSRGKRPLDLLRDGFDSAREEDQKIILQISDQMLRNGAYCRTGSWPYNPACLGSYGLTLAELLDRPEGAADAEVVAAARAITMAGVSPTLLGSAAAPFLLEAAERGRAAAVSILIVVGADPAVEDVGGGNILHVIAGNPGGVSAAAALKTARHFLGGLYVAGLNDSFDGWNSGVRRPLDHLDDSAPEFLEIAALLYERGSRCRDVHSEAACGVPFEERLLRVGGGETGWSATLLARDFAGAVFSTPLPDAGKLAALASIGLTLRANAGASPDALILSLSGAGAGAGSAVFTVTMRGADNQAAREFRVRAETVAPLLASLWRAVREGDAARTQLALDGLGPEHADATDRDGVTPLLIVAATLGHAEVVSLLIAAGADPDARHPSLFNRGVPHLTAAEGLPPSSALAVLRSFSGALEARATVLDWNQADSRGARPLDLLNKAHEDADKDGRAILLQISDEMLKNGATCLHGEWPYPAVCVGSLGRVLVDRLDRTRPNVAAVSVAWRAAADAGTDPNRLGSEDWPLLIGMAAAGRAAAVSAAIAAGADPNVTSVDGNILYAIGYRAYNGLESAMLNVARYFLGGLHAAGLHDSFDGWNAGARHPLEALDDGIPEALEIAALLYERGSRCRYVHSEAVCGVPFEERSATITAGDSGWALTLAARDFAGAVFTLPLPEAGKLAELEEAGLTLRTNTGADADEMIVSLARESAVGGTDFTITMMNAAGQASREFRVRTEVTGSLLPLLRDAVRRGDAERTRSLLTGLDSAEASAPDGDGIAPLVTAATLGHAEVVSVLVAGGADPAARNPRFHNGSVPHMMSAADFTMSVDLKLDILKHFGGAVEARATIFDWNLTDANGDRPLELLGASHRSGDNDRKIVMRMSDYMVKRGAFCRENLSQAKKYDTTCLGSYGTALANAVFGFADLDDDALRAAILAARESGVDLNRVGRPSEGLILPAAALLRHAHAVSILAAAGLNPSALSNGYAVLHHVGEQSGIYAPEMLDVLRHFIGGLHAAGLAHSFNGWNQWERIGRPLNAVANYATLESVAERRETASLLYERGARCYGPFAWRSSYCRVPTEFRDARIGANEADWSLTLTARDFGGAVFSLLPPDAGKAAELESRGWSLRVDAAATPDEAVLSRARFGEESEAAVFTVTMMSARGEAARAFQVRAQIVPPLLASLQAAVRAGDAARTEFLLSQPGPSRVNAVDRDGITPLLIAAASLGHAEVVSVLVAAGADPAAREPLLLKRGVAHLAASGDLSLSWAQKSEVLRYFIGGLQTRATVLNWNHGDALNRLPLDLLQDGFDGASEEDQKIMLGISDQMLRSGGSCGKGLWVISRGTGMWPYNPACLGSYGLALAELLDRPEGADASEIIAATRAITMAGISLTVLGSATEPFLLETAKRGNAAAVSILIVAGADPAVEDVGGGNILHVIAGNQGGGSSSSALDVLRHFIGGLHAAGLSGSFDGWNAGGEPALNMIAGGHSGGDAATGLEIAALLYERGARCGEGAAGSHCDVPVERHVKRFVGLDVGAALTLTARDFGGATFALPPPDWRKLARLEAIGLTLRTDTAADPDEAVLSLWRESQAGGATAFTVTMVDASNRAAREFRVSAEITAPLLASLWAAAREGDAESTRILLNALGLEHANAPGRDGVTPLLVVAATLGHAEVVSVLVVAGANPDPVWPGGAVGGIPHLMALSDLPLGWADKLDVLRSFSAALETRGTVVNWNEPNARNKRPLDLLNDSSVGADANDEAVILRISDLMLKNGGSCVAGEWPYSTVCAGSLGRALVGILDREAPDGAAAAAAWRAMEDAGLDPNLVGGGGRPIVTDAGLAGRAAAVSVLIALGADPDELSDGGFLRAIADEINRENAPEFLEVARHFFGGLHIAGLMDSFDGWNREEGPLLERLRDDHGPALFEIAALLYERGARCGPDARARVCGVPVENHVIRIGGNETGRAATLLARDFAGAVFSMPPPDAGKLAVLASIGLILRANTAASPDELILSRSGADAVGGSAVFTVTMMNANNQAAREFRVRAETVEPLLASLWNAAREGDAARTKLALDALGPEHADAVDRDGATPMLIVAATLGHAEVVSALVAAGADPDARHPSLFKRGVPHLMAAEGPPHSLAQKLAVLRSFSGALSARATVLNWNRLDSSNTPPLDLLNETYAGADEGERAVLLQMSEEMLKNGATCKDDEWPYPIACVGSLGRVLVDSLDREDPDVAAVSVALRAVMDAGIDPTLLGSSLWPLLVGMAVTGRAAALSVAIVAGVDPNVKSSREDVLYEIGYAVYDETGPLMLTVMRHFLGGLHVAGLNDSYNGWNYGSSPALETLDEYTPEGLEIAALMYERGSRCREGKFKRVCRIPIETRAATVTAGDLDWSLTLTARDFAGAVFTLPPPGGGKLAELEEAGLTLRAKTGAGADEVIVSLARESAWGAGVFTITMMNAAGQPSREFRVRVEIAGSLAPFLRDALLAGDAERARPLLAALGPAAANAPDGDGIAPLVTAATLGRAEVVSVLVVAGADPSARNPRFDNGSVPHMMSAADFGLSFDVKLEVLKHFGDAVEARATVFDWNLADDNGNLPLDYLPRAEAEAASDDARGVVLRMSEYMIKRGAFCRSGREDAHKYHGRCVGVRGAALAATITGPTAPGDAALRAAALAAAESGVDLNRVGTPLEGSILPAAALLRRARAVSILLTAGLDPGALWNGRGVLHHVGEQSGIYAPEMLDVLRHFIGGLHAAGLAHSFNGWNQQGGAGRPLMALANSATLEPIAERRETASLLYERGARCLGPGVRQLSSHCRVPIEFRDARIGVNDADWSLTLTARDFGGAVFSLLPPDAGKAAELESRGWSLRVDAAATPDEAVLSRARFGEESEAAVFTVTMMSARGEAARAFQVRAQIVPPLLASLQAAARAGDAARTEFLLSQPGPSRANAVDRDGITPLLIAAAALGHAEVVSVLAAAGADPAAREPLLLKRGVAHLAASGDLSLSWAQKSEVLRYFIGGLQTRATALNWNYEDVLNRRPLDLLREEFDGASEEDQKIILGMSDQMLRSGGSCEKGTWVLSRGTGKWPYNPVCLGSYGLALAELLDRPEGADASEIIAATRAITMAGISLTVLGSAEEPFLLEAAKQGHAAAVSILIVAGADPAVEDVGGGNILHVIAGNQGGGSSSSALDVLRHFIGGLHAAGLSGSFDGWNAGGEPALNMIAGGHSGGDAATGLEIAALLYERGARCGEGEAGSHCDVPVERRVKRFVGLDVGAALTVAARDFGGATFALLPPDWRKLARLEAIGLTLRTDTAADPDEAVLSLWRESQAGGATAFTVTMVDASNRAAREFRVSAEITTPLLASLWAAAREGDAESTRILLNALGLEHANAPGRDGVTPLLVMAATLGHAEVVSVLVVAGANPDPVWPGGAVGGIPHLMASSDLPLGWADKLDVLRSFSAALETRGTVVNWNEPNAGNKRPLDLLNDSSVGADANDGAVILRISDLMLKNGGSCVAGEWPYSTVCIGSLGRALVGILDREAPDGAAAAAAWRVMENAGFDPNMIGGGGRPIVTDAGLAGRAAAVSVLIALGADPDELSDGGFLRAIADEINRENAPEFLEVARHFFGGLHIAGLMDSFDGWNLGDRPLLEHLRDDHGPALFEIAALLYERGARCGPDARARVCGVPVENRVIRIGGNETGRTATLFARDFAGAVFSMPPPDAGKLAELASIGLTLRANTAASPDELILSRSAAGVAVGSAVFTVTMINANNQAAREFRVRAETVEPLLASLWNAVRAGDAERARFLLAALDPAAANAPDGDGIAPLVTAATLGRAEVVSVLVVAGADPSARNPRFHDGAVPHMMSAFDFPLARDAQWEVLKHFGDAVEARATVFDWNMADRSGNQPLDLLPRAAAEAGGGDARAVILRMSDYMIKRGAFCQSGLEDAHKYHGACVGTRGAALAATITGPTAPGDDALRAALRAAAESGVDWDRVGTPSEGSVLPAAAFLRRAHAVSILLTAGFDPGARSQDRAVLHHVGRMADLHAGEMLDVLRHFIGGLHVAGLARSFDGWNDLSGAGRPLDALSRHARPGARTAGAPVMEIHSLLHERGARCAPPAGGEYCGVPVEERFARIGGGDIGWSLTLTARDFGGAVFTLPAPDAGKLAELADFGLTLLANTAADPDEMVAFLARPSLRSGDAVFTVTMMSAAGRPAREFRVRTEFAPPPLATLRAAVRSGDAARTKAALAAMGPAHANAVDRDGVPLVVAAAILGHAEVVSVLVEAEADPNARHPSRSNRRIPHLMSANDLQLSLEKRLEVLRSFIGATEARATVVNWNEEDGGGRNPLELLEESSRGADAADRAVVLQMSDAMMRKGAACRFGGWPYSPACLGSGGLALAELLGQTETPDVAQVRAAMRAIREAGLDPNATGGAAEPILLGLAAAGRGAAASVFIAAGADPEVSAGGRNFLHYFAGDSGRSAQVALDILRYFIGGLWVAGLSGSFDGWNASDESPLSYFARSRSDGPAEREVAALMYERGARCGRGAGRALCRVPVEERLALVGGDDIGRALTLVARDFGGAVFTLPQPDADKLADMASAGWTLLANTAADPDEAILSRLRASPGGETAVFTVTMVSAQGEAAREFRVRAETTAPLLPSLRAAVRSGDAEAARNLLDMLGSERANALDGGAPLLAVAAALGHAKMVSVLITAGANPNARHPLFKDFTIPRLLTGDDLTLSGAVKWETLRHFGDAVETRATVFDWNQPDAGGAPPLESLPAWFDRSGDAGEREIILRATDYMLMRGARCRTKIKNALRFHSACAGTLGGALAAMLSGARAPDEEEMQNALLAMKSAGIPLDVAGLPERGHVLPIAADMGRAAEVSILLAAGADPDEKSDGRNVPHHAAWKSGEDALGMLEVVRGFIGGIGGGAANALGARRAKRFHGWNERDDGGNLPLDLLASRADPTDLAALELRALMYERGARCENPAGGVLCETPEEWRTSDAAVAESYAGDVMTIAARNFGDAVFALTLTDAEEVRLLEDSGWRAELRTDSGGAKLVLSRTRARRPGDLSAQFSAAARADGVDARVYKISACFVGESDMGGLCVPEAGNFEGIPQRSLCGAYGGKRRAAGGGAICSGMDINGTFCIEDSREAFPCRGLFKHVRACNMKYNRRALNPILCGARCAAGEKAKGARCCDAELLKSGMCVESGE